MRNFLIILFLFIVLLITFTCKGQDRTIDTVGFNIHWSKGLPHTETNWIIMETDVIDFKLDSATNTITVTFRQSSNEMYASNPPRPVPDKVWKEVYSVKDGKIILIEKKEGTHIPGHYIDEQFKFDDKPE